MDKIKQNGLQRKGQGIGLIQGPSAKVPGGGPWALGRQDDGSSRETGWGCLGFAGVVGNQHNWSKNRENKHQHPSSWRAGVGKRMLPVKQEGLGGSYSVWVYVFSLKISLTSTLS